MIHAAGVGLCMLVLVIKPALLQKHLYDLIPLDFLGLIVSIETYIIHTIYNIPDAFILFPLSLFSYTLPASS